MKYAYSMTSHKPKNLGTVTILNTLGFIEAATEEEALGKVYSLSLKAYPPLNGWSPASVTVRSVYTSVDDLATAKFDSEKM